MHSFEILCTTMHQKDLSKLNEMNIHSDVVFANQASINKYEEINVDNRTAKMITTNTRGVGKNRNIALIYASADICLLADDDMVYDDNVEKIILNEFKEMRRADAIIFNVLSDSKERVPYYNKKCKKMTKFSRNPYGAVRIAFKLDKIRQNNIWFTPMFGGGAPYPSGEDTLFIRDMLRSGMNIYLSNKTIGLVKYETSTWFKGMNEEYFYGKGSFIQASCKGLFRFLYVYYYAFRTRQTSDVPFWKKIHAIKRGMTDYKKHTV